MPRHPIHGEVRMSLDVVVGYDVDSKPLRCQSVPFLSLSGENSLPERIGEQPKPRLLILNLSNSELKAALSQLAPTVRFMEEPELQWIRQRDWDAAVVFGSITGLESHLFVIQFGGTFGGAIESSMDDTVLTIVNASKATQFEIPDDAPDSTKTLIKSSLVKAITSQSLNGIMRAGLPNNIRNYRPKISQPFISDIDGHVLAGCFIRPESFSSWWWLPASVESPERWVAAALADWSNVNANVFPAGPTWQDRVEWQTPEEVELGLKISETVARHKRLLNELEQEEFTLRTDMESAAAQATATVRRLLTSQGDELVDEVYATFEELGFTVVNVDSEIAKVGDRREDLRINDPDRPGWTAIAEVRGYKRGAQLNDLLRINRFVTRYLQETGELPDSAWYVVNHSFDQDPMVRPSPLTSHPLELQTFAESNGLIIDTRFLFRLRMKVRRGEVQPAEARAQLTGTTGLLEN